MNRPTPEQSAIIQQPPEAQTVVIAGPGTGKTYTLVARCMALAEDTSEAVLVLSFTRAVVREIRSRAAEVGGLRVTPATIDGFAARVVLSAGEDLAGTFDGTIERARELLTSRPEVVQRPGHVLVDEVQDLVGPRLDFVLAVLGHAVSGFTTFGDPQQAIYGWGGEGAPTEDVFDALAQRFPRSVPIPLSQIHRPKVAEALGVGGPTVGEDLFRGARPLASVKQARLLLRGGRAVLLTRSNGEALALSDQLSTEGLATTVRQGADARLPPAWIAAFANADCRHRWSKRQAVAVLEVTAGAPLAAEAWGILRRLSRDGDGIALSRLREAVARPTSHDDFSPTAPGLLSTIHRAKGLEWDDVIVLEPLPTEAVSAEENRVLFVAATRARRELWRLRRPDFGGKLSVGDEARWEVRSWQGRPKAMEVRIGDVDGAVLSYDMNRVTGLAQGASVDLLLDGDRYVVSVGGVVCATTTDEFRRALKRRWKHPVDKLVGARVLATRTFAGDPSITERVGLPPTGLWAGIEIVGFVRPEQKADNQ